jgi:hypothetical protein
MKGMGTRATSIVSQRLAKGVPVVCGANQLRMRDLLSMQIYNGPREIAFQQMKEACRRNKSNLVH